MKQTIMKIKIEKLTLKCIVGILPHERKQKQKIVINASFTYIFQNNNFIDYAHIVTYLKKTMKKEKFKLLEEAIIHIKEHLNTTFKIKKLKLKITKPNIMKNCKISLKN